MVKGKLSKSRVDEIKDEQGQSFFGADVASKFVDHFERFFGASNDFYPIKDPSSLFTRKLCPEVVVDLIKEITNEEIKEALFDIDDNKASGPDDFTSKSFKATWRFLGRTHVMLSKSSSIVANCLVSSIPLSSLLFLRSIILLRLLILDLFHAAIFFTNLLVKLLLIGSKLF